MIYLTCVYKFNKVKYCRNISNKSIVSTASIISTTMSTHWLLEQIKTESNKIMTQLLYRLECIFGYEITIIIGEYLSTCHCDLMEGFE